LIFSRPAATASGRRLVDAAAAWAKKKFQTSNYPLLGRDLVARGSLGLLFAAARPWGATIATGATFLGSWGDLIVGTC